MFPEIAFVVNAVRELPRRCDITLVMLTLDVSMNASRYACRQSVESSGEGICG